MPTTQDEALFGFVELDVGLVCRVMQNIELFWHRKQPAPEKTGAQRVVQIVRTDLHITFELHRIEGVRI